MFGASVIVFRESLEAALIIGIIATATRNVSSRNLWLGIGIGTGVAGSILVAALTEYIAALAQGAGQELFNAGVLGLAALMLAWHNIWMARHGLQMSKDARQLGWDVTSGNREMSALAIVVAMSVLREGAETVLFLTGLLTGGSESLTGVIGGASVGLLLGALAGLGLYAGMLRIPVRLFFTVTSGLILLLAAALSSQAARFLSQADLIPSLANPLWNTSGLLDNSSMPGRVLHTLIGYEAAPSGIQVLFYVTTLGLVLAGMRWFRIRPQRLAAT
jgi:high-affinity iron transporter